MKFRVIHVTWLVISALLVLGGCDKGAGNEDIPAQNFGHSIDTLGKETGELTGRIQFPTEYSQRSAMFNIGEISFVTHPDGRFRLKGLPRGRHQLQVRINGYEKMEVSFDILPDEVTELANLNIQEAKGRVLGRLVDGNGKSASGLALRLSPSEKVVTTDNDGIFQFLGVGQGRHVITLQDPVFFTANRHLRLGGNETQNLGNIEVFRRLSPQVNASPLGR
ncbi:MAG: hypothetical protein OEZ59_02790 [Deltaproteobacteria bacterium]|nr:hypothetical protein [Deltaproteobacteria bacterium]